MPRFSLSWALLVSLVVHAMMFAVPDVRALFQAVPTVQPSTRLEARLLEVSPLQEPTHEPLLKNTLSDDELKRNAQKDTRKSPLTEAADAVEKPSMARASRPVARHQKDAVQWTQRKLSRHMYYPPEAIDQGLEGEVRLLLRLTEEGRVLSVSVAASSGFPVLDQAALAAARAMGQIPEVGVKELLLPVVFRLQ